jgi:hypothetical protein
MQGTLTHGVFRIAGRLVACGIVSSEVRIKVMRRSDVAENDVAGDVPICTFNLNPNLLQSTRYTGKCLLADLLWTHLIIDDSSYSI